MARHLIQKQLIHLSIRGKTSAFTLQHEVSRSYWNEIVPLLERVFDRIAGADEVIEIDRLEIDAGIFTIEQIEQNKWAAGIEDKILRELEIILRSLPADRIITRVSRPISVFRQWLYFLEKGYLPWNNEKPDELWYQQVFEALATDYESVSELCRLILSDREVRKRIVYQHSASFLEKMVAILTAKSQTGLTELIEELTEILFHIKRDEKQAGPGLREKIRQSIDRAVLVLIAGNEKPGPLVLMEKICTVYIREPVATLKSIGLTTVKKGIIYTIVEDMARKANKAGNSTPGIAGKKKNQPLPAVPGESGIEKNKINDRLSTGNAGENVSPDELLISENIFEEERPVKQGFPIGKKIPADGIFVSNAGLVLLHYFLSPLFNFLGLVKDHDFTSDDNRIKALYLLHYLATGSEQAAEH
ncbi:MAG TPA: contractile injection system tape measure protein, partial [Chitinophagaceae bacterium]|nr:contractile injection system tape measure protein [Chitinophagaceae bacterium]